QDMRRMGNLKKYLPVTFATMFIGTLAIAGIPPFSGFFSKDEILYRAFLNNKAIWVLAVATALMTAFYMFRLIAMTVFGAYRGPAWEADVHAIEAPAANRGELAGTPAERAAEAGHEGGEPQEVSRGVELGLMGFSVLIAAIGIGLAWKFYVVSPEMSDRLATNFAGAHRLLSNKYYVDELYDATVISGTMAGGRGLWTFDRRVVDGVVNGSGWATLFGSWLSS